ncbi:hypothetical protein Taro_034332 [Colocasia esculenta]|uniref:Uncharacterized protein n=1 Tax=Colocasia esculenta TaxID=4460 RepID=A0A843W0I4_COLES|nr:hypothetical protein [Colocasia esculenta]
MHPLAQDMPLGHRSELDHQEDYQIEYLDGLVEYSLFLVLCGIVGEITLYHQMGTLLVLVEWSISLGIDLSPGGTLVGQDDMISDRPSEPCAGTQQQPDDAGPPQFSPDVMTFSQHGLYDVGASQILTDEDMPDTQPPQSTVGSISEDIDSETAQSESCDAILVQSEIEVDAQDEIQE